MATTLRLELLPELKSGTGLFLHRVRAVLGKGDHSIAALGAGISTSSETAKAKAVSEALERLTLDPAGQPMISTTAMVISGTLLHPISQIDDMALSRTTDATWASSACHLDLESAIRAAVTENVERRHLWKWAAQCEDDGPLMIGQPPPVSFTAPAIASFLATFPIKIAVSWATSGTSLPALVVIALRTSHECFYAASAAAEEWPEAFEAALLDIAKVLIVEQQLATSAGALSFRRPLSELPDRVRHDAIAHSIDRWPPICSVHPISEEATLFGAPWLTKLKRQMVAIPILLEGDEPKPLEWFK